MELFVIYPLHFETGRKAKVPIRKRTTTKNMYLWLLWQRGPLWYAKEIDAIVARKERVVTMREAASRFFGIKTGCFVEPNQGRM